MIDFRPIASSSAGNAYILSWGGEEPLLLDAGVSFDAIQQATRFRVASLAGCLITHAHGDHCRAVQKLLTRGVDCFATSATWRQIGKFGIGHRAHDIDPMVDFQIGNWQIKPFIAVHDAEGTVGFMVARGDKRCLYLTDSCYSPYRFDGLTHIFVEANHSAEIMLERVAAGGFNTDRYKRSTMSHMSIERLIEMLKSNDLSKAEEIHLLHLSDGNSDEAKFRQMVQEETGVPTFVAGRS